MQNTIPSLPLFQGMTNNEIAEVIADKTIQQQRYAKNQVVVGHNQPSKGLLILLDGRMCVSGKWKGGAYRTTEIVSSPCIIEPERCFGLYQRYQKQYVAKTACCILYIPKSEVLKLTRTYMVFKLNLLNAVSTIAQQRCAHLTEGVNEFHDSLLRFLGEHFLTGSTERKVYVTMNQLAEIMHCSRLEISQALNRLEQNSDIILQRGIITLPSPNV